MSRYIYDISGKTCNFPKEFGEAVAFATLGTLEKKLKNQEIKILSFAETQWVDIAPLLLLGVLIGNMPEGFELTIDLGEYTTGETSPHASFIVFFINEGFFDAFYSTGKVQFSVNGNIDKSRTIKEKVITYSSKLKTCLLPHLAPNKEIFSEDHSRLPIYVDEIIKNVSSSIAFSAYGGTVAKERTLEKIRQVVQELLQNIYEHAYQDKKQSCSTQNGYFAIFVRMIPPEEDKNTARRTRDQQHILHMDALAKDSGFPRIEIYILDAGVSLKQYAERLASSTLHNVIASLGNRLLKGDKVTDRLPHKSEVSGLKHIGGVLKHDQDFIRLFTVDGMAGICCEEHDKEKARLASIFNFRLTDSRLPMPAEIVALLKNKNYDSPSGTSYCISIPIYRNKIDFPEPWYMPSQNEKESLYIKIKNRKNTFTTSPENTFIFFDRLFDKKISVDYPNEEIKNTLGLYQKERPVSDTLVIRLPRHVSKNICDRWLNVIADVNFSFKSILFIDVSPSFALQLYNIVASKKINIDTQLNIRILTTTWHTASLVVKNGSNSFSSEIPGFTAHDFYSGENAKVFQFIPYLIEHDSKIFWENITEIFFHNGKVEVEKGVYTEGYLHFKEAIATDKNRRTVCKLAMRRILHLLPVKKIIPIEPLISSLAQEMFLGFKDYIQEDGKNIALVSVNATSTSFSCTDKYSTPLEYQIACFQVPLQHQNYQKDTIIALDWLPNYTFNPDVEVQKRVEKTPYILPNGSDSIESPHYIPGTHFKKSTYGCLKKDTYKLLSSLDCLRFQHTKNGTRHDLLSLNTVRAIESSLFTLSGPYSWLSKQLSQYSETDLIIYPSHYANDIILEQIAMGKSTPHFFSVSFFSEKGAAALRLSPSSELGLVELCKGLTPKKIVIFDDGVITGKHLDFLKNYLHYALNITQEKIFTLALVDRTRTPLDYEILAEKSKQDIRYWRHDVPAFAEEHACIFCHALHTLKELLPSLPSAIQEIITQHWLPAWEVTDIYSEWGSNGLQPISIEDQRGQVVFGKEGSEKNTFQIYSSTTLLSYIVEVNQFVPHKLTGISKGSSFIDDYPEITIELIAGQFFLLYYELNLLKKEESLEQLFKAVLSLLRKTEKIKTENNQLEKYLSLASLCFLAVEKPVFSNVWEKVSKELSLIDNGKEWQEPFKVLISILFHHSHQKEALNNLSINSKNLISTGAISKLSAELEILLKIIGVRKGEHHTSQFTKDATYLEDIIEDQKTSVCHTRMRQILQNMINYKKQLQTVSAYYQNCIGQITERIDIFEKNYIELVSYFENPPIGCGFYSQRTKECKNDTCKEISQSIIENIKAVKEFQEQTKNIIFERFIFRINKDDDCSIFLNNMIRDIKSEIKERNDKDIDAGNPQNKWIEDYYIITPDEIRELIKDIITNTRKHSGYIHNKNKSKHRNEPCSFYWTADIKKGDFTSHLILTFVNKSKIKPNPQFSAQETRCLKEYLGTIKTDYSDKNEEFCITLKLHAIPA